MSTLRTLLIDNYDSFTFNLFQLLSEVNGREPHVIKNDDIAQWLSLEQSDFDNVVISPGPGRPENDRDFGISSQAIAHWSLPTLGVCLGYQGIVHGLGGEVNLAPEPVHGRLSDIFHNGKELFAGIPSPFRAVRYHSLVAQTLPQSLVQTAQTPDGLTMAVRHRSRPLWGVQFHPESIATAHGRQLLMNFRLLTERHRRTVLSRSVYQLHVREFRPAQDPETAFVTLFPDSNRRFWLDSSKVEPALSRFSFIGDANGPLGESISYDVQETRVQVERADGLHFYDTTIFDYLKLELARRTVPNPNLPFPFNLGYVGYLGYELKRDCGAAAPHQSPYADAFMLFADRMIAFDHNQGIAWAVALSDSGCRKSAEDWVICAVQALSQPGQGARGAAVPPPPELSEPELRHSPSSYMALIQTCLDEIKHGETYEVCLTNMISSHGQIAPLDTYRRLRHYNPAPYSAYLDLGGLAVLSSSPERFLTIDCDGNVESKPIKGTRQRGTSEIEDRAFVSDLAHSEKDQAENLMIVDLVRNDLGSVAEVGSVSVPVLFGIETYATVHQLVSTVRATIRSDQSPVDCVRAAFPGGSMTGAPKLRTMEILDRLEGGSRGVYSGALGYFALSGAVDLSIVIRTMVVTRDAVTLGVGGAIVAQSDPTEELTETLVKARAMLHALGVAVPRFAAEVPA